MQSFIQFGPVVSSEQFLGSKIGHNIYKYEASCIEYVFNNYELMDGHILL